MIFSEKVKLTHGAVSSSFFGGSTELDIGQSVWASAGSDLWFTSFQQNPNGRVCSSTLLNDAGHKEQLVFARSLWLPILASALVGVVIGDFSVCNHAPPWAPPDRHFVCG